MIHFILYPTLIILLFSFIVTARKYHLLYINKCRDEVVLIEINNKWKENWELLIDSSKKNSKKRVTAKSDLTKKVR